MVGLVLGRPPSPRGMALIVVHGLVDAGREDALLFYPAALLLPDRLAAPGFFAASCTHFAMDSGWACSLLLHFALGVTRSLTLLQWYMLCVHLPLMLRRLLSPRPLPRQLAPLAVGVLCACAFPRRVLRTVSTPGGRVVLSPFHLKAVVAHVCVDLLSVR